MFGAIASIVLAAECATRYLRRRSERPELRSLAAARARTLNRPLVVVGAPTGGVTSNYDCGDLCVDLVGCRRCGSPPIDLCRPNGIPMSNDSCVVFVSCVVECLTCIEEGWREILRVAGDERNVFVVYIKPWSLTLHTWPHTRWMILSVPPEGPLTYLPMGVKVYDRRPPHSIYTK